MKFETPDAVFQEPGKRKMLYKLLAGIIHNGQNDCSYYCKPFKNDSASFLEPTEELTSLITTYCELNNPIINSLRLARESSYTKTSLFNLIQTTKICENHFTDLIHQASLVYLEKKNGLLTLFKNANDISCFPKEKRALKCYVCVMIRELQVHLEYYLQMLESLISPNSNTEFKSMNRSEYSVIAKKYSIAPELLKSARQLISQAFADSCSENVFIAKNALYQFYAHLSDCYLHSDHSNAPIMLLY